MKDQSGKFVMARCMLFVWIGSAFLGDPVAVADNVIDFAAEVAPILETHCSKCHSRGNRQERFTNLVKSS